MELGSRKGVSRRPWCFRSRRRLSRPAWVMTPEGIHVEDWRLIMLGRADALNVLKGLILWACLNIQRNLIPAFLHMTTAMGHGYHAQGWPGAHPLMLKLMGSYGIGKINVGKSYKSKEKLTVYPSWNNATTILLMNESWVEQAGGKRKRRSIGCWKKVRSVWNVQISELQAWVTRRKPRSKMRSSGTWMSRSGYRTTKQGQGNGKMWQSSIFQTVKGLLLLSVLSWWM